MISQSCKILIVILCFFCLSELKSQQLAPPTLPIVHNKLTVDTSGVYIDTRNGKYLEAFAARSTSLTQMRGNPTGTAQGLAMDFGDETLQGSLYYGFIPYQDTKYPQPVYFRSPAEIKNGKAEIPVAGLRERYDMIDWQGKGKGVVGYRVIDAKGNMLYQGRVGFKGTGPFEVDDTIVEGPFVNLVTHESAVIWFSTNNELKCAVEVNEKSFKGKNGTHHEILVKGLKPDTRYEYTVKYGKNQESYTFTTAPAPGSRKPFVFSYASDSRSGPGGGERNLGGANAYIMKKIMALNTYKKSAFMQFTGDMVTGYKVFEDELRLEYANWKMAIEPFAHHMPVTSTMGNHEALMKIFQNPQSGAVMYIDKYPFETSSGEALYASEFVNPKNGPKSEDGAYYDPSSQTIDFPPYAETVFYYTYDNVAIINLNSDYWYAPTTKMVQQSSGNIHGYIMNKQLEWLSKTVEKIEKDPDIDHIFLTLHTPFFPNGGHVQDDMWYGGNNDYRPVIAGKRAEKGIIERRDELLDIIVNNSKKVKAILTGDEHNYCRTEIGPGTEIYPEVYLPSKIEITRTIHQINNGAAGAPYYAQQQTPWTPFTSGFTTQNALVFFHVNGNEIEVEVLNPDTLEELDRFKL